RSGREDGQGRGRGLGTGMAERLEVHLVTPQREMWSGEGTLVVARGTEGEVGIQKGHVPLLIRLDIGVLRVMRGNEDLVKAVVDGGFMHVTTSPRSEEHTSELQSRSDLVCRLLLE